MTPLPFLRLLLSVTLVWNGIGGAMAATRMHVEQATIAVPESAGTPCHEHQHPDNGNTGTQHEESPAPDCCKSGLCVCACAHLSQVPLPSLPLTGFVAFHDLAAAYELLGRAPPALPHLIRPPIG